MRGRGRWKATTFDVPYAILGALALNAYGYLRATVDVDVLVTTAAVKGETFSLVSLETLIELKIASGMTAPHRLRDLADVIELIRVNSLAADYRERLHPYVRDRLTELWQAAQAFEAE